MTEKQYTIKHIPRWVQFDGLNWTGRLTPFGWITIDFDTLEAHFGSVRIPLDVAPENYVHATMLADQWFHKQLLQCLEEVS